MGGITMPDQIDLCATRVRVVGGSSGQGGGAPVWPLRGYAIHVQTVHLHVTVCLRPRRRESRPETWRSGSASRGLATMLKLTCWVCGTICQLWGKKEPGLTKLARPNRLETELGGADRQGRWVRESQRQAGQGLFNRSIAIE